MPQTRRLAAIMFTDIVGYTALMGRDEKKAFELLKKNREIQKPIIEEFHGQWIKELGDGVMASFDTVSDAVMAALKIQEACTFLQDFQLRIGIHLGEVVFENGDVFGDGVNIAARIQVIANPGSIYISESCHQNVSNKQGIQTHFIKNEWLKNVKEQVRIYEVVTASKTLAHQTVQLSENQQTPEKSIAVLAFVNMSNDPEQEYFSDGMAEEILNSLAQLKALKVASRTSSFSFKGKNASLQEIGEKLKVNTILEGSIRKQGNRLRITAQLINVADGFHLWSEKFDRNMDDIFAIQDEIALAITKQLKLTLFAEQRNLITKSYTQNAEAYELYLKGIFHINRRGSSILTGLQYFERAIEADPGYALAYNGYADAMIIAAFYGFFTGNDVIQKVRLALDTAIRLDDSLPEIYCTRAQYFVSLEWTWDEARDNYLKSIELNSNFAQAYAYIGLAYYNHIVGNFKEGEKYGRSAVKLEPLSAIFHADLSWIVYNARRFDEALSIAKTGIELDNNSFLSHKIAGLCCMALNRHDEAIEIFKNLIHISNRHQFAIHYLIWVYCDSGNLKEAKTRMDELERRSQSEFIAGTYLGLSAAWMNDMEKAFLFLEKGLADRDSIVVTLKRAPHVPDKLRKDPRFQELLDRVGFPP
jgi:adenylate cyclase